MTVRSETIPCPPDTFDCPSNRGLHRRLCLPTAMVCDGRRNCVQGEDEQNCAPRSCYAEAFQCQNGICIPQSWVCDRDNDCGDMSDEPANCSASLSDFSLFETLIVCLSFSCKSHLNDLCIIKATPTIVEEAFIFYL